MWNGLVASTKKMEAMIAEPIRVFMNEDLRHFKVSIDWDPIVYVSV